MVVGWGWAVPFVVRCSPSFVASPALPACPSVLPLYLTPVSPLPHQAKSTLDILRSLAVFSACRITPLVTHADAVLAWAKKVHTTTTVAVAPPAAAARQRSLPTFSAPVTPVLPRPLSSCRRRQVLGARLTNAAIRATFYKQFVAGESVAACAAALRQLAACGIGGITVLEAEQGWGARQSAVSRLSVLTLVASLLGPPPPPLRALHGCRRGRPADTAHARAHEG